MAIFAVFRRRAEGWDHGRPLTEQAAWQAHADFMDALEAEVVALLVGPLEDNGDALLILRADSNEEIERRLAADPWTETGLLETVRIAPWTLRIGSLS